MQVAATNRRKRKPSPSSNPDPLPAPISLHFKHSKSFQSPSPSPTSKPKSISVGSYSLTPGVDLLPLVDSTPLYLANDFSGLFRRLDSAGVILIRGVIPTPTVIAARTRVLSHLRSKGAVAPSSDPTAALISRDGGQRVKGWTIDADSGGVNGDREDDSAVAGWKAVGTGPEVRDVYHGPALHSLFHRLFSAGHALQGGAVPERPFTAFPDCTWLRIRGHGDDTQEHTDYYYFKQERSIFSDHFHHPQPLPSPPTVCVRCKGEGDEELTLLCDLCDEPLHTYCHQPPLPAVPRGEYHCRRCANLPFPFYTAWVAMGRVGVENGRLALVEGSHRLQGYEARGKGEGKLPTEWTAGKGKGGKGAVWRSADMEAGDVLLFNIKTVHAASPNCSEQFRMSCDTRVTMAQGTGWQRRLAREREEDEAEGESDSSESD